METKKNVKENVEKWGNVAAGLDVPAHSFFLCVRETNRLMNLDWEGKGEDRCSMERSR